MSWDFTAVVEIKIHSVLISVLLGDMLLSSLSDSIYLRYLIIGGEEVTIFPLSLFQCYVM
jgi:hypothetical protein